MSDAGLADAGLPDAALRGEGSVPDAALRGAVVTQTPPCGVTS